MSDERLSKIEFTLEEHSREIASLKEMTSDLAKTQSRQCEAIDNISGGMGEVLGEIGSMRKQILSTLSNVDEHVMSLDSQMKAFQAACDEKHKMVDYRLERAEYTTEKALEEIDDMSEQSKVNYIRDLQSQLRDQKQKTNRAELSRRTVRQQWFKLLMLIVSGLLTGTGGTMLIQWLVHR